MTLLKGLLAALLVAASGVGEAQSTVVVTDVGPGPLGRTLRRTLADPQTHVVIAMGRTDLAITPDSMFPGSVVILGSRVIVTGQVKGDLIVVGGDLFIHPGARIGGRAVAIGGGVYPSTLAQITGGSESNRDVTFQATQVGKTVELRYLPVVPDPGPLVSLPGIGGVRQVTYDRSNGVSVPFTVRVSFDSGRLQVDPAVTYRSQLGAFDPHMTVRWSLDRRDSVDLFLGRISVSNDRWIQSDLMNSLRALWDGHDSRNWYRADRAEAKLFRRWEIPSGVVQPYVGARLERGWSERPDSTATGGPWSLFGRHSDEGILRPNPAVTAGTIASALTGAHTDWDSGDIRAFLDGGVEVPVHAPGGRHFVQTTVDGQITFPTFGVQRLRTDVHAVVTLGDTAPPQRWAYLGGVGSIPTLELLEIGGDQLFLIDSRYEIPLTGVKLRLLGSPTFAIRNVLGRGRGRKVSVIDRSGGGPALGGAVPGRSDDRHPVPQADAKCGPFAHPVTTGASPSPRSSPPLHYSIVTDAGKSTRTTLAVIPARLGAMRLPRKPLRLLAGLPLVIRVWERVSGFGVAARVVIATDSDEVARTCRAHGAEVMVTDPMHPSGTDRVAEVAADRAFTAYDLLLNVQGDEPFVSGQSLQGALGRVSSGLFELGTAAARASEDVLERPHVVKVIADDTGRAMYFSRAPIPFLREPSDAWVRKDHIWHHLGVYAYTRGALARWVSLPPHPLEQIERLEQLRPLAAGMTMGIALIDETPRAGIDTEDDLARANSDWTAFRSDTPPAEITSERR